MQRVARERSVWLTRADAERLYGSHRGRFFYPRLVSFAASGPVTALELTGDDAVARWRAALGPTRRAEALAVPDCARARCGFSDTRNALHGSDADESAAAELAFFFGEEGAALRDVDLASADADVQAESLPQ